jgi:hypothetical protein
MNKIMNLILITVTMLILPGCCGKKCCKAKMTDEKVQVVVEAEQAETSKKAKELAQ